MDQDTGVRQTGTLSLFSGTEKDGTHRCGHSGTDCRHVGFDELHRVVDRKARSDLSSRSVDVQGDVRRRICGRKEEELRLDDVCDIIVNRNAQEYDPVHQKPRENIHRCYVELALLDDSRIDVGVGCPAISVEGQGIDSLTLDGEILEFVLFHVR